MVGVGHIAGERAGLDAQQRIPRAFHHGRPGERLGLSPLVEQVGAEQSAAGLFIKNARIPAVGHVRCGDEAETIAAGFEQFITPKSARRADREVVEVHLGPDQTGDRFGLRRVTEPLVQRAAFVALEMTEADVAQAGGIDQDADGLAHFGKHSLVAGVEKQGMLVTHQKVAELEIDLRNIGGDAIGFGGDFGDGGHGVSWRHYHTERRGVRPSGRTRAWGPPSSLKRCRIERFEGASEMTIRRSLGAATLGIALSVSVLAQSANTYKARLTAVPADARTRPSLAGIGNVTATVAG